MVSLGFFFGGLFWGLLVFFFLQKTAVVEKVFGFFFL